MTGVDRILERAGRRRARLLWLLEVICAAGAAGVLVGWLVSR